MRAKTPWILFAAIFGASFLLWKLALEPHARGQLARAAQQTSAPATPLVHAASTPRAASAADSPSAAAAISPTTQRVRVVVRLGASAPDLPALEAELLRLDEKGKAHSVAPAPDERSNPALGPRELSELLRADAALPALRTASATFELREPGSYAAAWHTWRPAPGTLTWRAVRGNGTAIEVERPFSSEELLLELELAPAELALDPSLDARVANAITHVTAKDG